MAAKAIRIGQERSSRERRSAGAVSARVMVCLTRAFFPLSRLRERVAERTTVREAGRGFFLPQKAPSPRRFAATLSRKRARGRGARGAFGDQTSGSHPEDLRIARLDLLGLRLDARGIVLHQLDIAKLAATRLVGH